MRRPARTIRPLVYGHGGGGQGQIARANDLDLVAEDATVVEEIVGDRGWCAERAAIPHVPAEHRSRDGAADAQVGLHCRRGAADLPSSRPTQARLFEKGVRRSLGEVPLDLAPRPHFLGQLYKLATGQSRGDQRPPPGRRRRASSLVRSPPWPRGRSGSTKEGAPWCLPSLPGRNGVVVYLGARVAACRAGQVVRRAPDG